MLEWGGQRCGYIVVENRESDVHVRQLVLHPDFQNRGIGSGVLGDVTAMAALRSVPVEVCLTLRDRSGLQSDRMERVVGRVWCS